MISDTSAECGALLNSTEAHMSFATTSKPSMARRAALLRALCGPERFVTHSDQELSDVLDEVEKIHPDLVRTFDLRVHNLSYRTIGAELDRSAATVAERLKTLMRGEVIGSVARGPQVDQERAAWTEGLPRDVERILQ